MFSEAEVASLEAEAHATLMRAPIDLLRNNRSFRSAITPDDEAATGLVQLPGAADALLAFRSGSRAPALIWARKFSIEFLANVRASICSSHKTTAKHTSGTITAKSAATALASWLMATFAVSNPAAIVLATFVILAISSAALSAFCTMTDDDIEKKMIAAAR